MAPIGCSIRDCFLQCNSIYDNHTQDRDNNGKCYRCGFECVPSPCRSPSLTGHSSTSSFLPHFSIPMSLNWTLEYATAYLAQHLDTRAEKVSACLEWLRRRCEQGSFLSQDAPNLLQSVFLRLDESIFDNLLSDRVWVAWDSGRLPPSMSGGTYGTGVISPSWRMTTILINERCCKSTDTALTALIHHMIHAYFLVACGARSSGLSESSTDILSHGHHFALILDRVKQLSITDSADALPLDSSDAKAYTYQDYEYDYSFGDTEQELESAFVECRSLKPEVELTDAISWYEKHCAALARQISWSKSPYVWKLEGKELVKVSRKGLGKKKRFHELIFIAEKDDEAKNVVVESDKIKPDYAKGLFKERRRYLEIPACDRHIFILFYKFLTEGKYKPDLSELHDPLIDKEGEAPLISTQKEDCEWLVKEIRLFKLGAKLQFEDLKSHIMKRMKKAQLASDDPVTVLKEIYQPSKADGTKGSHKWEPEPQLRQWAREFLSVYETTKPNQGIWLTSNLHRIEEGYKAEWAIALAKCHESVKHDVEDARLALRAMTPETPPVPWNLDGSNLKSYRHLGMEQHDWPGAFMAQGNTTMGTGANNTGHTIGNGVGSQWGTQSVNGTPKWRHNRWEVQHPSTGQTMVFDTTSGAWVLDGAQKGGRNW